MNDFAQILDSAGGAAAPPSAAARLRTALGAELARGARELGRPRSGYDAPLTVGFSPGAAVAPLGPALRADPGAVSERAWLLAAAVVGSLVEAGGQQIQTGTWNGHLVLAALEADPELAVLAFHRQAKGIDRLRVVPVQLPTDLVAADDLRAPVNPTFGVAERVARMGGRPANQAAVDELGDDPTHPHRPHDDPDPGLRAARRMLLRLRGMGKWGGYHTEFSHLAKGFPGHERALALAVGEALVAAGLLVEKPSVGQRHVFLDPRRAADIHALIDRGELPSGVRLPG